MDALKRTDRLKQCQDDGRKEQEGTYLAVVHGRPSLSAAYKVAMQGLRLTSLRAALSAEYMQRYPYAVTNCIRDSGAAAVR